MNKPSKVFTTIQLVLGLIAVLLFCSNVFLIVGFVIERNSINELKNGISNIDNQTPVTPSQEEQGSTNPTTKPNTLNVQEQTTTWIKGDTDFSKYIPKIQDKTNLPFFYYMNGELTSDIVLYSMIDKINTDGSTESVIQNIENYEVAYLNFKQKFKSFDVAFNSGVYGAGGMCEQSYFLETKVEGITPSICTNPGIVVMGFKLDLLGVNKTYESAIISFTFPHTVQKSDLEEFAKGLVRVN